MAKRLDLVGKRFGNLLVVSRAENNAKGNTQWKCLCDCGNIKIALGYDLTHGRTTTCGCKRNISGKPSQKRISLIGNKYGKLTVVSLNEQESTRGVLAWDCVCDCGNSFIARGSNLKSGKATHCGCVKQEHGNGFVDITGKHFERLTVIGLNGRSKNGLRWDCVCECGNRVIVNGKDLRSGHTKSCGCLSDENRRRERDRSLIYDRSSRLYNEYWSMRSRCSPSYHSKKDYYDRGIRVCDDWQTFEPFQDWALANGYRDDLTIDRIDVNAGYSPDNCRWVTNKAQQNNKRDNVYITIGEQTKTMKQWSEYYGVSYGMVKARRKRGWPQERWFEPPHK